MDVAGVAAGGAAPTGAGVSASAAAPPIMSLETFATTQWYFNSTACLVMERYAFMDQGVMRNQWTAIRHLYGTLYKIVPAVTSEFPFYL